VRTLLEEVAIGSWTALVERPADPEALIDEERFADDEFLPYWAEPWPSGLALAAHVSTLALRGLRVVEVGCGLGLPSLAAARAGADVLATDWAAEAVELLERNAERNGLRLRAERVDWRETEGLAARGPFALLLAADVVYERRNIEPLARLVQAVGCDALVADPGRQHAGAFLDLLRSAGVEPQRIEMPRLPRGALYHIRAA
jgi:predicted nicotinamide N-methyase